MDTGPKRGVLGFLERLGLRRRKDSAGEADRGILPEMEDPAFHAGDPVLPSLTDGGAGPGDADSEFGESLQEEAQPLDGPDDAGNASGGGSAPEEPSPEEELAMVRGGILGLIASRSALSDGPPDAPFREGGDGSEEIVIEIDEEALVQGLEEPEETAGGTADGEAGPEVPAAGPAEADDRDTGNPEESREDGTAAPVSAEGREEDMSTADERETESARDGEPIDGSGEAEPTSDASDDVAEEGAGSGAERGFFRRLLGGVGGRFARKAKAIGPGAAPQEDGDPIPAGEEPEDAPGVSAGGTAERGESASSEDDVPEAAESTDDGAEHIEAVQDQAKPGLPIALDRGDEGLPDEPPSQDVSGEEETRPAILRADGTPLPRHRLGEYVLHKGLITVEALDAASREQEVTGERIGQILVANGFLSDRDRVEAILETSSERIAQESVVRSRIPSQILDEQNIMISAETEETIYVSTMQDEEIVRRIVAEYYADKRIEFVSFLPSSMNGFIATIKKSGAIDDASESKETMLDRILYRALNEGASDIHIIPRRKSYTTMFRLLGVRRIVHEGGLDEYKVMIAQIKDRARMDLAERRKPQDGGFQIEYSGKMIDLRVATVPTAEGETCIMRVLDPDRVQPSLNQLGITDVDKWRKGFNQQHGLCLICGPTGSGKTTTLNSSIKEMDRFGKAIYTIEDPVEYRIPFAGQVSVNTAVGLNFASAVRAFMRADPDVIVLGEVRDEETARNAIKAADTGHLVLATLHTGSIVGAVSRLKDLGVAPRELRYLLRSVLVQSLVRTLCRHCGGAGCAACKGGGYAGRTVVSECEYFEGPEQVDKIINAGEHDVERTWPTMAEDAVSKYRQGITDLDELYRVFGASIEPYLREKQPS